MHRSTSRNWSGLWMILLTLAAACTVKAGDSTDAPPADPAKACVDMADAVASAAANCGQSYQSNYEAFVNSAASGDCNRIKSLRDEDSLYMDCIPFLQGLSCSMISDPTLTLPASCQDQLIQ